VESILQNLRGMGQGKLAALAAAGVLLTGFFIFLALNFSSPNLVPLYTGLSMEDSGKIVTELEKTGVKYDLRGDGSTILVPADQVLKLRVNMAQSGLPSGGSLVGYEIFDRQDTMGSSNFVMNINMLRALEGELGRTIASIGPVESARVHLVMPKRELFTRDKQDPTASVIVKLRGNMELSKAEIGAITHLVATAVPGLKPSRITIVDNRGNLLAKGAGADELGAMAEESQEFRIAYENRMRIMLENLLERTVGEGKVKVQVNADIDFDRVITNKEQFDPEGQVARSVQTTEEKEQSNEKNSVDDVSVANNLPDAQANNQPGSNATRNVEKTEETSNFEISKVVQNHVKESGSVRKLSVAVLVDGTYASDEATGASTYSPRSPEEIKQIETLTRSAMGYDEKRGDMLEVVNMRFSDSLDMNDAASSFDWIKSDLGSIINTLMICGVAVLILMFMVRPLVNHWLETTQAQGEPSLMGAGGGHAALSGPGGAGAAGGAGGAPRLSGPGGTMSDDDEEMVDIDRVGGKVKSGIYKKINLLLEKHPEESLGVVRQWIFKEQ